MGVFQQGKSLAENAKSDKHKQGRVKATDEEEISFLYRRHHLSATNTKEKTRRVLFLASLSRPQYHKVLGECYYSYR